ncbi:MAG: tetratricopeptide repeat protein, partial [Deltaproteobacteria bacterium]|nr:tetratricopeptide repeat protein [Deltaproteobacteria bacterium]
YKLGWIRINQEKFKESLDLFEAAVSSAHKGRRGAVGDPRPLDVKREALSAMVWPFSEVRKAYEAPRYFRKLAESKTLYVDVLRRLANRYFIKTEYVNAALLYREIVRLSADVEKNIEYVQRIYDSVRHMSRKNPRRYANAAQDVDAIVTNLARFENHLKFKAEDKEQLEKDFEVRARDLATRLHVEAQQKSDAEDARIAAEAYRKYLSLFVKGPERQAMQVNRAESLYQSEGFVDAGRQYEDVAKEGKEQQQRDMVYHAILAYHKAIEKDSEYRSKHPTKPGLLNKLELLRAREGLKQLGAYYVKAWPSSDKTPSVKFNVASMYYQQGEYERAAELFRIFVGEYPTHKDAPSAGNLALDALHKLDQYDEMAKLAQAFVDNPKIKDTAFKNEAARIAQAARKRKVEFAVLTTSEGEFSERMLSEWEKHKGTQEGEEFLYTAFVKYKGEGSVAGVFDFGGRIIGAYPKSKRLSDVLGTMGTFALRAADFERAAFYFEEFHKRFPNEKNSAEVLRSAARIRTYLGQYDQASADFRILRGMGNAAERTEAHEALMQIYRDIGDWESLARVAQTTLKENERSAAAAAYLGIAYMQQGKDELAERELGRAARMGPRTEFEKEAHARGLFSYGQLFHRVFDATQFRGADEAEAVLGRKLQLLQAIDAAYGNTIKTGQGEYCIAALRELSRLYNDFGVFITNAPAPAGLSAAEEQQYRAALKGQGDPYIAKAKETLQACALKSEQLKIFTAHASACETGGQPTVGGVAKRRRGEAGDEAYQQDLVQLRQQLAKTPESVEVLQQLARRAMQVGDYHLAKLTLSKAAEVDPRSATVQNLLGVANWQLGEPAAAYDAFDKAAKRDLPAAFANLAALFYEYGYERQARQFLGRVGNMAGLALQSADFHPSVERLQELLGS